MNARFRKSNIYVLKTIILNINIELEYKIFSHFIVYKLINIQWPI